MKHVTDAGKTYYFNPATQVCVARQPVNVPGDRATMQYWSSHRSFPAIPRGGGAAHAAGCRALSLP